MKRRDDFEAVCTDVGNAISEALARHNLDPFDAIAVCAVVGAMASPFKLHHLRGTRLTREVGRFGQMAYNASCLARSVEEIKSSDSLVVNPMMDAIAGRSRMQSSHGRLSNSSRICPAMPDGKRKSRLKILSGEFRGLPFRVVDNTLQRAVPLDRHCAISSKQK